MAGVSPYDGQSKTKAIGEQVNEVVGIMQGNIDRVMERGDKLNTLQTKTDDLQQSSMQFKRGASRVRKQMWWKEMKIKVIIAIVVIVIIIAIAAPLLAQNSQNGSAAPAATGDASPSDEVPAAGGSEGGEAGEGPTN